MSVDARAEDKVVPGDGARKISTLTNFRYAMARGEYRRR